MTAEQWIVVPNWDRFQHYSDRDPVWVKTYTALLHDEDYLRLSGHARSVLHGLWLAYASSNGQLPLDARSISSRLQLRVSSSQLESLIHAGFIEVSASRPLALRYPSRASRETETEKRQRREEVPPTPRERGDRNGTPRTRGTNPRAQDERSRRERHERMVVAAWERSESWDETRSDLLHERLDAVEEEFGAIFTDQERDALIDATLGISAT